MSQSVRDKAETDPDHAQASVSAV